MRAGNLVVDISANVARLQADMAQARGVVESSMKSIERSANVAKNALAGLAGGLSLGYVAGLARDIVKATAALDDMAEITGTTVENLSRFSVVAKIGSHDMGLVEDSLVKLTKGLKGADEETGNAAAALEALGIKAKDSAGKLRDPGEIMREVALKLFEFKDGAGKTAIALDLFGKSGAKLLPFLKDMAEEGAVAARVTAEQAAQAEVLEKNLNRLKVAAEDSKREFLMGITPALVDFTEKLLDAQRATGGLAAGLAMMATAKTGNIPERLSQIDRELEQEEKSAEASRKLAQFGGIGGFGAMMGSLGSGIRVGRLAAEREYLLRRISRNAEGLTDDLSGTWQPPAAKPRLNYLSPPKPGAAAGDRGKTAADLLNESAGVNKDFFKDLSTLHAEYARGGLTIDQYREAVERLIEKQQFSRDAARNEEEARKAANQAAEAYAKQNDRQIEVIQEVTQSLRQRAGEIEAETSLVGASAAERERANEFLKIENQLRKASIDLTPDQVSALRDLAEAEKSRIGAAIDAKVAREEAVKAAEDAAKEWKNTFDRRSDALTRTISDGLMRGFEKGAKSGAEVVIDTLKNALKTAVFEPVIHAIVSPVSRAVTGALMGGVGSAAYAGGGGGGSSWGVNPISLLNSGSNFLGGGEFLSGLGTGLFSSAGTSAALIEGGTVGLAGAGLEAGALGLAGIPGWGWALGGAALLGGALGLFGGGGGPKTGEILLQRQNGRNPLDTNPNSSGLSFVIGNNNLGGNQTQNEALLHSYIKALNDPSQYDPDILAQYVGTTISGNDAQSSLQQLLQTIAPAAQGAQGKSTARSALLAAQDPAGYWRGQVESLDAALGTSAKTLEQWRSEFLAALDGPLSADQLAKWQALGDAINNAANAAGAAAAQISPREFSTLVDYRRAVRLVGGVPKFAGGGAFEGGWRVVGEAGPEIEFTGPSRIVSNSQARQLVDNSGVERRLERLEVALQAIALHSSRTARLLDRFDGDGMPVRGVDPLQPLEVQVTP